jgi:hypothetical protein
MAQINKPSEYFNTVLYTGNGSTQSITGVGFQPDWVWQKTRNFDYSHSLADVVRGASLNMFTNNTLADQTVTNGLTSFDSDGFSVGADLGWNASAGDRNSKVAWNWLANGAGVSNTDGTITSTVSANTTSGFSIVTWTTTGAGSATVGHGLGATPKIVLMKSRDSTSNWTFYTTIVDGTLDYFSLDLTDAKADSGLSSPTSSVFSQSAIGGSGGNAVAYCFAEKKGFSKFGSYTGNGSADGTFVYTGFKPAFVMIRSSSLTTQWSIVDNKRATFNQANNVLYPNLNNAEVSLYDFRDYLSNGFKLRTTDTQINASGASYIYMAFAENPLVGTNNIPTTAR